MWVNNWCLPRSPSPAPTPATQAKNARNTKPGVERCVTLWPSSSNTGKLTPSSRSNTAYGDKENTNTQSSLMIPKKSVNFRIQIFPVLTPAAHIGDFVVRGQINPAREAHTAVTSELAILSILVSMRAYIGQSSIFIPCCLFSSQVVTWYNTVVWCFEYPSHTEFIYVILVWHSQWAIANLYRWLPSAFDKIKMA